MSDQCREWTEQDRAAAIYALAAFQVAVHDVVIANEAKRRSDGGFAEMAEADFRLDDAVARMEAARNVVFDWMRGAKP